MADERTDPPAAAGEREMLDAWLDYHRATLLLKCEGLTDDQLRLRSVPPSGLSLLGLVRHMAEVERGWFRHALLGEDVPDLYATPEDRNADFNDVGTADAAEAFSTFAAECAAARQAVASFPSLDSPATAERIRGGEPFTFTLRWIMVHMIEEYARHNGHADLLRERIDGATGA
jgi:uncharacterized damage-inducible protein DinB